MKVQPNHFPAFPTTRFLRIFFSSLANRAVGTISRLVRSVSGFVLAPFNMAAAQQAAAIVGRTMKRRSTRRPQALSVPAVQIEAHSMSGNALPGNIAPETLDSLKELARMIGRQLARESRP